MIGEKIKIEAVGLRGPDSVISQVRESLGMEKEMTEEEKEVSGEMPVTLRIMMED